MFLLNNNPIDMLSCAVLRGENPLWPQAAEEVKVEAFLRRIDYHGVTALLYERLHRSQGWPANLRQAIRHQSIARAAWELRHQEILTRVHSALARIGVQPIILKGTALAYALYPNPILRTRADTDIIIPSSERRRVHHELATLGFELYMGMSGEFVSYQGNYTLNLADSSTHNIDLHWKINNSELLSRLFSYGELLNRTIHLPKLCPDALGVHPVYALLLACMHRGTHNQNPYYAGGEAHYSADRLIWIYDIHLLATSLSSTQWHDVLRLAREKGLCATCLDGLEFARACFHTHCPDFVLADLAGSSYGERSEIYLNASKLRQEWMDFRTLEFSSQLRFVRELVFPPAAYMRSKYQQVRLRWLPWLYARRAFSGLIKRIGIAPQRS